MSFPGFATRWADGAELRSCTSPRWHSQEVWRQGARMLLGVRVDMTWRIALCGHRAEVLGTQIDSIVATEDREIFKAGRRSM